MHRDIPEGTRHKPTDVGAVVDAGATHSIEQIDEDCLFERLQPRLSASPKHTLVAVEVAGKRANQPEGAPASPEGIGATTGEECEKVGQDPRGEIDEHEASFTEHALCRRSHLVKRVAVDGDVARTAVAEEAREEPVYLGGRCGVARLRGRRRTRDEWISC